MSDLPKNYTFDNFHFDADRLALYHQDVLVKTINKKTLKVLAVLLIHPNKLTTHEEIIENVWQDNMHGVTSDHVRQYASKLRKVLTEFAPGKSYIETVKGLGYSFVGDVSLSETDSEKIVNTGNDLFAEAESNRSESEKNFQADNVQDTTIRDAGVIEKNKTSSFISRKSAILAFGLISIFIVLIFGWQRISGNDEEKIRQVVKDSQFYESLVLYKNPSSFNEESLNKYWTTELDINSNYDRQSIRAGVLKLKTENTYYGNETKCEQFEFQSVEINNDKDLAVVKTLEKWFIAVYFNDGTLQKNKTVGPYFVNYILRKIDGKWLIEKSTTARVNRPTPRISNIEITSEAKSKQQFLVKITGQDFEPETILIEVTGEGCPESSPCKVPNSALRENSKLSDTAIDNIPLTLANGNFKITARNGDSQSSNSVFISVP